MNIIIVKGLEALEGEDLSGVVRLANKKMLREGRQPILTEEEAATALKQYYALPFLRPGEQQFAVSSTVDDYWHSHILDTFAYQQFCARVYGHMMHHGPLDQDDEPEFEVVKNLYDLSRTTLLSHFGELVSPLAYPDTMTCSAKNVVVCVMYCEPRQAA